MRQLYFIIISVGLISSGFSVMEKSIDRCQTRTLKEKILLKDPRYETFFRTLLLMAHRHVQTIVETVNEQRACSTMIFEEWANNNGASLYSTNRNKGDLVDFFETFSKTIDLLYLGDLKDQCLEEIVAAETWLAENSVIVISDRAKGKLAIEYFLSKGWKISCQDDQAILVQNLPDMTFQGNPFAIEFPAKENLSHDDYIEIQEKLRKIDIEPLLGSLYPHNQGYLEFEGFWGRTTKGIRQTLIDPERGLYPRMKLEKIGTGGDNCIVCCAPYNDIYPTLISSIPEALHKCGFNGYFLYLIGGFPNPTGREIQYVGVPYSFKIFMMLEAQKLGFNKVLWIDSSTLPLRDPTPLFNWINSTGALVHGWPMPAEAWNVALPATRKLLEELTGIDALHATIACTVVFGLKMNTEKTKLFIQEYYRFVEMGLPFLSCFPEEMVFMTLIAKLNKMNKASFSAKKEWTCWKPQPFPGLFAFNHLEEPQAIESLKKSGVFFYHRPH